MSAELQQIIDWERDLDFSAPTRLAEHKEASQWCNQWLKEHRVWKGSWVEAMLGIRVGEIDIPHEIVQSATNGFYAYLHGVIHRIEGDYWNAKYWFRRVGSPGLIDTIQNYTSVITEHRNFDPALWTDKVQHHWSKPIADPRGLVELEQIATQEWRGLWDWGYQFG